LRAGSPRRSLVAALAACLALLGGCGGGGDDDGTPTTAATTTASTEARTSTGAGGSPAPVYFTAGEQLRPVPGPDSPEAAARALVAGPPERARRDLESEIPDGTRVEGVSVTDGIATVAVSARFTRGISERPRRRSADEQSELDARLAQMTYTLTGVAGVERAKVLAGGVPVGGIQDREDFAKPAPRAPRSRLEGSEPQGRASAGVRAVQERLARLRYLPKGAVDGIDGYRTRQAVTAFQAWEGLERDGIAGPLTKAALADAKRPRPRGDGPGRRMEVYRDRGVTLLVKHDRTKRAIHTSSGAPGYTTPAGRFEVFRKEVNSWSVPYQVWLPWASYFNAGIAFHGYPDVPPHPASHGCVRVPEPEAEHVYDFARIGTPVIVR
jgi:hypothetical protein